MKNLLTDIKWTFKRIKHRIYKFIYWVPIIWKDFDWDHYYFLVIIRHKLNSMKKYFSSDDSQTMDAKDHAVEMNNIIEALDRIINQDYGKHDIFKQKYPDYDFGKSLENSFVPSADHPGMWEYKSDMTEEQQELFLESCNIKEKKEQDDYKFIFESLRDHIQEFWD